MEFKKIMKAKARPYAIAYRDFRQTSNFVKNRRPVFIDDAPSDMETFLDLLTFLFCYSCGHPNKVPVPAKESWVEHHHNGELLAVLRDAKQVDIMAGITRAFDAFLSDGDDMALLEPAIGKALTATSELVPASHPSLRAMDYFYAHRTDTFIRHGIERLEDRDYQTGSRFPVTGSMLKMSLSQDGMSYAIDTDRVPFDTCFGHGNAWPWYYCSGHIAFGDFRRLGGEVIHSGDREHFYARSNLKVDDWVFVYQRRAERTRSLNFSIEQMQDSIQELKGSGVRCVERSELKKFFRVVSMLSQRCTLLGVPFY